MLIKCSNEDVKQKRKELFLLESKFHQENQYLVNLRENLRDFELKYTELIIKRYQKLDLIQEEIKRIKYLLEIENKVQEENNYKDDINYENESLNTVIAEKTLEKDINNSFFQEKQTKRLYREAAKMVHPDFAINEIERQIREYLMIEINEAYANDDSKKIQETLTLWKQIYNTSNEKKDSSELWLINRKIIELNLKLQEISEEIKKIHNSELYQIKERFDDSQKMGIDLLTVMTEEIDSQITMSSQELKSLEFTMERHNENE